MICHTRIGAEVDFGAKSRSNRTPLILQSKIKYNFFNFFIVLILFYFNFKNFIKLINIINKNNFIDQK